LFYSTYFLNFEAIKLLTKDIVMRKIIVILFVLVILPTLTYGQNKIIGGNTCDISQRPFQVFIAVNNGKSLGAGGIIG